MTAFSDDDLKRLKEIVDKHHPTDPITGKGIGWWHIEALLARLEAAERVVVDANILAEAFKRMQADHKAKLVDGQTFESAQENFSSLLQEPLEFGPLIADIPIWRKAAGKC